MATAPLNTDLSAANMVPGVYVQIQSQSGSGVDNPNKRVLILGTMTSAGTAEASTPALYTSQDDVNTDWGRGSEVARAFAALQSQYGPGEFETWVCGVAAPSAAACVRKIIIGGSSANEAGYVDVYVAGYKATVSIASGDTPTIVGTAITNAINLLLDCPASASGTTTVSITYRTHGLSGNDLPIRVDQFDASGLTFSAGTLAVSGTASGAATLSIVIGAQTYSVSISNLDVNTVTSAAINTAINAVNGPVTATEATGTVTLFYVKGRYVRNISATLSASITQTVTSSDTAGTGVLTLTTALSNISALGEGFAAWIFTAVDPAGADLTCIDAIYDQIQIDTNGTNQKPALVFFGSARKLATAGLQVTAASPALTTTSPLARFTEAWCREAPVQAFEIAARYAAAYLHPDYYAKNLDGVVLSTRGTVPLLNPAVADRPPLSDINAAMLSYYMTPITVDSQGNLVVVRAMTTSNSSNADLREVATVRQVDTARYSLRVYLVSLFSGKSYRSSNPKTPNTVTTGSVKDAIYVWTRALDDQDLFDDAPAWKDAIRVNVNAIVPTRFDAYVPLAIIRMLHQLGVVVQPV